jgi:autotransporter translocation and assembly factor TamB
VPRPSLRSVARIVGKSVVYLLVLLLILLGVGISIVETGWAKNQIRALIVRQANQYLTANLEIGRLEGSLFRGLQLGDIRLSRDNQPLVTIDDVRLSYSIRELWQNGTVIRRIRLVRPRVVASKMPDGRWDLGALVRREAKQEERSGPGRPIQILAIEVMDGTVELRNPQQFGAAYIPTRYEHLDTTLAFTYRPVTWTLTFTTARFVGSEPDLTINRLSGAIGNGPGGWRFDNLFVETPRTTFSLAGHVARSDKPTVIDLRVHAPRFAFQEWGGVLHGLKNIAIDSSFDVRLLGPLARLDTSIDLQGTGGSVNGNLVLDTTIPGWHGSGTLSVARIDLARWLSKPDKPSDISGRVTFNLDLDLGKHFPRGTYAFDGPHAAFMSYAADNVKAHGRLTATHVEIAQVTASAYGASVTAVAGSTIGLDDPFPFHFQGAVAGIDLRNVPRNVPVPHVESTLSFNYDVTGRFSQSYIIGRAAFQPSVFLGAAIGAGTTGVIDTLARPITYAGEGDLTGINLHRFGGGLNVGWMQAPRYEGTVAGHFHVQGTGTDSATLTLSGGGRLTRADMFHGTLSDADVTVEIAGGTLNAAYNGRLTHIDPAVALSDPRFAATLNGTTDMRVGVRDLLTRPPTMADYDIAGTAALRAVVVRDVQLDRATFKGQLHDGTLRIEALEAHGPAIAGSVSGVAAFSDAGVSALDYQFSLVDLAQLRTLTGQTARGIAATKGRLTGPYSALRLAGTASVDQLNASGVDALTVTGDYDVTIPSGDASRAQARVTGRASFPTVVGQRFQQAAGSITMAGERIGFDVQLAQEQGRNGGLKGDVLLHMDRRAVDVSSLTLTFGNAPWRLARATALPTIAWSDQGIDVAPLVFLGGAAGDQRLDLSGTWRTDGNGALQVKGTHVFLETLAGAFEQPTRYGGVLDVDATIRGTRAAPVVTGTMSIVNGRVQRVSYQKLAGRVDFTDGMFTVDLRLDQAPGVWLTAAGTLPLSLIRTSMPERAIDVAIVSSKIDLGLVEGLTTVMRTVTGTVQLDVRAVGTSHDPHVQGSVEVADAGFLVAATGTRYKNVRASFQLASERITVNALHVEDSGGHPLDVKGSLGTHELRVGELEIDATASHFEVMHNEFGKVDVDARLQLRGRYESPRIGGSITINNGDLQVDQILERALFQPYATQATSIVDTDAVAALNPWQRLGLDIFLHVPNTLKLSGDNVQVASGTPIGLGSINLRVAGDLYLYKDPGQPLSITGSFDSLSGRYGFQGRLFDVDPASSINFRGDLNPELYVTVKRLISGVEARVTIAGPLREPELRLASTPPLDSTDILSLIVFGTPANELSASQQQNLAVRAGTLAAGFLASPILAALQNELGLDILQVETSGGGLGNGPKVTVGDEIAPGLVARFSRQFGSEPYDEVTFEYYLSRLFRLRATFSDAQTLVSRSPFRRIERAGIDLLLFFSF